jgi:hypothetical protein
MLTIVHGENVVASRNYLLSQIDQFKKKSQEVLFLDEKNFTPENLVAALEKDLFGQQKVVVFESFSRLKPNQKKEATEIIKQHPEGILFLWEAKTLPASFFKPFPKSQARLFKPSPILFQFLDALSPKNKQKAIFLLGQVLKKEETGLVFYFLTRRISDLILIKENHEEKVSARQAWQKEKLKKQAQDFSQEKLTDFLCQLIWLDYQQKSGQLAYPFEFGLELLLAKI